LDMADAHRLLREAMDLPPAERARLAEELLASLDEREEDVERAWAAEIERRAQEIRNGATPGEEWRKVLQRIQDQTLSG
jgi:putative addiction module component (TIGR02574 family)